jgi:uncharacterized LabA/DUF88 family protein
MTIENTARLALLIDGDNATPKIISALLAEVANFGSASVKRIYGDWTNPNLNGWKACLAEHAIQPVQQFANSTGKNATDGALIIDAMDLLYSGRFSGFCIVSSDGDFTRLAARIREQGLAVYGFGERKTPRSFIRACEKFVYFDVLNAPTAEPSTTASRGRAKAPAKTAGDADLLAMLKKAISAVSDEDGRANLARVGAHLAKQAPDFDVRNYGFTRLSELVEASGIADVERTGDAQKTVLVQLKT